MPQPAFSSPAAAPPVAPDSGAAPGVAATRRAEPRGGHGHLWATADGTGLHAPLGQLVRDEGTGRVCCHLCGRWFLLLGAHVRAHGHTAATYRALVGLCSSRPLAATELSLRISGRQRLRYTHDEEMRERLAPGQQLAREGQLGRRAAPSAARTGRLDAEPLERKVGRQQQLAAGRDRQRSRRQQQLTDRLHVLGAGDLPGFLRQRYAAGASLQALAVATGLGRAALVRALDDATVVRRSPGSTTAAGRRSRAVRADAEACRRLGVDDLPAWLRDQQADGWSLRRMAAAVGHSSPWVRSRLQQTAAASVTVPPEVGGLTGIGSPEQCPRAVAGR